MKFIVDLWLDGYEDDEEMKQACIEFIQETLEVNCKTKERKLKWNGFTF